MNAVNGSPKGGLCEESSKAINGWRPERCGEERAAEGRPEDQRTPTELERASLGALPAGASPAITAKPQTGTHQQAA